MYEMWIDTFVSGVINDASSIEGSTTQRKNRYDRARGIGCNLKMQYVHMY